MDGDVQAGRAVRQISSMINDKMTFEYVAGGAVCKFTVDKYF